jgi:ribosome-binding protein aMBF1 (putative translation factor)
MIQNEREYRISKAQAEKFAQALVAFEASPPKGHPKMQKAYREAMQSQLDDLQAQLKSYESLKEGTQDLMISSLSDLPKVLIQARIASGLSQKELAGKLGLKEQQIQRYEASLYGSASLTRLLAIAQVLGIRFDGRVVFDKV